MDNNRHLIGQGCWLALLALFLNGCGKSETTSSRILATFAREKEQQSRKLGKQESDRRPSEARQYFGAVEAGRWQEASNRLAQFSNKYSAPPVSTNYWDRFMRRTYALGSRAGILPTNYWPNFRHDPEWEPMKEVNGAVEVFQKWDLDTLLFFGSNIIDSIPTNSIYFGETDSGRFVITALCKSQINADPFFTLTQNKLADPSYLDYVRAMYGRKIQTPSQQEHSAAFAEYLKGAMSRYKSGTLPAGENVSTSARGSVSVSGARAVKEFNGLIVKQIFESNTNREFYIEESMPADWMYPHLTPHGLIMKINRDTLPTLDQDVLHADRLSWNSVMKKLLGFEVDEGTRMSTITDFAEAVYLKKDLSWFKGDRHFAASTQAQESFARLRIAIAGLYVWRADHAADDEEKQRMLREADLAFLQAFVLCPRLDQLSQFTSLLEAGQRAKEAQQFKESLAKFSQ